MIIAKLFLKNLFISNTPEITIKKCAAEATHEKHIALIAAKQIFP